MIVEYTIEQFIEDFEMAQTPDAKQALFQNLIESDIDLVDNKELLIEYKAQIQDLREQLDIEEDIKINDLIDNGSMELMTCIKAVDEFVEGSSYYVMIDDVKSKYTESFGDDIPQALKDYLNGIKPLVWIVNDSGIGTLKYRKLVTDFELSDYFTK
jgi:hypothetical protein